LPVGVLLGEQSRAEALGGDSGPRGLPNLFGQACQVAFDLPAQGWVGREQPFEDRFLSHAATL
jgi:hypothetical protein